MKKFKFNRFNIIIFCASFVLLIFFIVSFFHSYSDYVKKDDSKREGDTIYINDLADDYYYYLGMNYVGDINSSSVSYNDTNLKMVTINYYGYNLNSPLDIGYVSNDANERQKKFVYYKYFPIKNGQITFDLIDNPFLDRPRKMGFAGWSSDVGTITQDNNTKVQSITISSTVDTVNIYANWKKANVIYLDGVNGDDNFNGLREDSPVGSWGRAFQLLENNVTNDTRNSRDLNIIVLIGNMEESINYSTSLTHNWNNVHYNYEDTNLEYEVLIVYQSGNNLYALNDNWSNVSYVTLGNSDPPLTAFWLIKDTGDGYTIQNENTGRYLRYEQYYNTNIVLRLTDDVYKWNYDSTLNAFYKEFEVSLTKYNYQVNNTFTNGNSYLITKGNNIINAMNYENGIVSNLTLNEYNYTNTLDWTIRNVNNNLYTIYNNSSNSYLTYSNANNDVNLALGNSFNWTYNNTNNTFSANVTHRIVTNNYSQYNFSSNTSAYIGYVSGNSVNLLEYDNQFVINNHSNSDDVSSFDTWRVSQSGNGYTIRLNSNNRYLVRDGTYGITTSTSTSGGTWTYNTTYHVLSQQVRVGYRNYTYYISYDNGEFGLTTSRNSALNIYIINVNQDVDTYNEIMYIAYNDGWTLESNTTNASLNFTTYTSTQVTDNIPYYIKFDNEINNFNILPESNNSTLRFMNYTIERNSQNTSTGNRQSNNYYSTGNNIPVTITSLYNHVDYRENATWDLTYTYNGYSQIVAQNDLQLEYLKIASDGYNAVDDENTTSNYRTSYSSLIGNAYNVRISRGMTPASWTNTSSTTFCYMMGGSSSRNIGSSTNDNNRYRFVVESGRYSTLALAQIYNNYSLSYNYWTGGYTYDSYNYYGQADLILGNDYDRALKDNDNLDVYYRLASSNYYGLNARRNSSNPAYVMTLKSGKIGVYYFENEQDNDARAYAGIYVGGLTINADSSNGDTGSRVLVVEGGMIANINGGLRITETSGNNNVNTKIYVKNGNIQNIVGGAGVSTTYGNRFISVTGGKIAYSVSGGSNGYRATGSGQDGKLDGNVNVHIGGESKIGTIGSGELYGVTYGSVLGAGNGNSDVDNSGQANNSTISISDKAIIYGNVYGGGNFGNILEDVSITIDGGTINGDVYGGPNRNGVGTVTINGSTATNKSDGNVTITMNDGKVNKTIYGGSCLDGDIAGEINITINGGTIGDGNSINSIFGGGYGENTNVASGVNLKINDNKDVNINGTVYGGSALGTVIGNINVESEDTISNGNIKVSSDVYCGSMGDSNNTNTGSIYGNCTISLDGGTFTGNVYGGNNANGSPSGIITVNSGGNNTTTINNMFGGGNQADSEAESVTVNIKDKSVITNAFGGGNEAEVANTIVNLQGGTATNIYGGSNQSGNIQTSTITTTGGTATNIYGGNNLGGKTITSTINVNGATITNLYGGGNKAETDVSNINLNSGTVTNTYGGGNEAGITTSTNIELKGSTTVNIFGGSNTSGNVPESNITATSGTATNIYGGNNLGGKTTTSNVEISNISANNVYGGGKNASTAVSNVIVNSGTITNIYGGGEKADTTVSNVMVNNGTITNIYGGGESASIETDTNVDIKGGTITNIYGGSNQSGTVPESNVHIISGTIDTIYGGNNAGGTTVTTNVIIDSGTITNIYGGGSKADSTTTNVTLNNSSNEISYIFGGCKEASATTTNVILNNGRCDKVFGGSNTSGTINTSNVTVNNGTYKTIYGGNNDGGKTNNTNVTDLGGSVNVIFGGGNNATSGNAKVIVTGGTVNEKVYGGGNNASVNNTDVLINSSSTITGDVYGGGNNGEVDTNTVVNIDNSSINGNLYAGGNNAKVKGNTELNLTNSSLVRSNLYGGGNNGEVLGNTKVDIKNSTINGSAYAGGNGETAVVNKDTLITVEGTSHILKHVFGGGNAAATGLSANDNSNGTVNITGGTIEGNVYGGANTSVLYGETVVNIGYDAVCKYTNNNNYIKGNISISGTVFGGGEANASGSEVYDFDFISVTKGIIINIDGNGHSTFDINGSIFGSGNASRTTGYSRIYINNYGSDSNIKNNVSLQRADLAVLNNSHIALSGATDRTNEYSQVVFSLSRITELDLKNNSEIYLENGANLLTKFRSLNSDDTIASVDINENTHRVTRSTNNRLYIQEDKVLNIAKNQNVTDYGEVDGMTFFGMFKRDRNGNIVTAMYKTSYSTGQTPLEGEMYYFNSGSYVLGKHETNHNIKIDGFYTNYDDPDNPGTILVDYITPSPEAAEHYMWTIGVSVQSYDIELIASRFSTLGTYEFPFINNTSGNTTFSIVGFNYDGLNTDVSLVNPSSIPRIASNSTVADNTFGLAIKPGIGWITVGDAYFLTDSSSLYGGTTSFKSENSNITPSFVFYLYHSKNLQTEGLVGNVIVSILTVTPIDDLTNSVERINFNITITRAIFDSNDYEGAMTPGREYEMFTSSNMDITSKSSLSAYYSLFLEEQNGQPIYRTGHHRVLASNILFPVNTKITMIDFASANKPQYYYYIVNDTDNAVIQNIHNQNNTGQGSESDYEYPLANFIRMGSLDENNKYDDELANSIYFDDTTNIAVEEFIFIVDFNDANITSDMSNCSLLIEMMDISNNIIHSVLGIQRSNLTYNLHANHQSVVSVNAEVSKDLVYIGDIQDLRITVDFNQNDSSSTNRIIDTTYYEQKLGLKISFFDERGNQINGVDLMGTSLTLDGNNYYARSDGTIRFKIADKVANSYSNIKINTTNSSLSSGNYTIRVETFYSVDGIYFGTEPVDYDEVTFRLMSRTYGLESIINPGELIINKINGKNDLGNNNMNITINYSGALINPNIKVAMYRRNYNEIYDNTYSLVDIKDYVSNELVLYNSNNKIYDLLSNITDSNNYILNIKDSTLKTGTYKLEFRLYDGTAYVGDVIKYIVIK